MEKFLKGEIMKHVVDHEPLQNVLNYLGNRPYAEVAKLVEDLMVSVKTNAPVPKLESAFPTDEPTSSDPEPK